MNELHRAIAREDLSALSGYLERHGLDVDQPIPECGGTLLRLAAIAGSISSCRHLIDRHGASIYARDNIGRTALMEMIRCRGSKWPKGVAELLSRSVNEQDWSGMTALMFASMGAGVVGSKRGNITIIRQLISFGADLGQVNERGRTAVGVAEMSNAKSKASTNDEVVAFLKEAAIEQRAMKEFHAKYQCLFDSNGVLALVQK